MEETFSTVVPTIQWSTSSDPAEMAHRLPPSNLHMVECRNASCRGDQTTGRTVWLVCNKLVLENKIVLTARYGICVYSFIYTCMEIPPHCGPGVV